MQVGKRVVDNLALLQLDGGGQKGVLEAQARKDDAGRADARTPAALKAKLRVPCRNASMTASGPSAVRSAASRPATSRTSAARRC